MPDQQRWDSLSCYGNKFVVTPNTQRLADEGMRFSHAYTTWPVCTPARATMWTGMYPSDHNVIENVYGVADVLSQTSTVRKTLFDVLKDKGYETAHFGKWHLGEEKPRFFDVWEESFNSRVSHWMDSKVNGKYRPEVQTERCVAFLEDPARRSRPFIAVQGYYPPHDPFTAPEQFYEPYRRKGVPNAGYYAAVTALDEYLGRMMDTLDATGLRETTVIIYFSDHGETFLYREDGEHKFVCFEEAIHIPFLLSYPGVISEGLSNDNMVGLQDIYPTILDYAGIDVPDYLHGMSLKPLCEDPDRRQRDHYYVQNVTFRTHLEQRCIRTRYWKLIGSVKGRHSLFDLANDPEEEFDLFDTPHGRRLGEYAHFPDYAETIERLAIQMKHAAEEIGDMTGLAVADNILESRMGRVRQ